MMTCSTPAATASSTAYWMIGLSTSGSISFGCAFVAGRKRVPQPAAGKTAFRTRIEPRPRGMRTVARVYAAPSFRPRPRPAAGYSTGATTAAADRDERRTGRAYPHRHDDPDPHE